MSDAQNIPVFLRSINDAEPRFLGRVPVGELSPLVHQVQQQSCYDGEDSTNCAVGQFICYQPEPEKPDWLVGFEIIVG